MATINNFTPTKPIYLALYLLRSTQEKHKNVLVLPNIHFGL